MVPIWELRAGASVLCVCGRVTNSIMAIQHPAPGPKGELPTRTLSAAHRAPFYLAVNSLVKSLSFTISLQRPEATWNDNKHTKG